MKFFKIRVSQENISSIWNVKFKLKKGIAYTGGDQSIHGIDSMGNSVEMLVKKGSFWEKEAFDEDEDVVAFYRLKGNSNRPYTGIVYFISSQAFFDRIFFSDTNKVLDFLSCDLNEQLMYMCHSITKDSEKGAIQGVIPDYLRSHDGMKSFYGLIRNTLLSSTRAFLDSYFSNGNVYAIQKTYETQVAKILLQTAGRYSGTLLHPTLVNELMVMDKLNAHVVGYDSQKNAIAKHLSSKLTNHEGSNIFLVGLPNDVKDAFIDAIIEVSKLPYLELNVGEQTSILPAWGCDHKYSDSKEPGSLASSFYNYKTTEMVCIWSNLDLINDPNIDRGKDDVVYEKMMDILVNKRLTDDYLVVPISMNHTINLVTALKYENISSNLRASADLVVEFEPAKIEDIESVLKNEINEIEQKGNIDLKNRANVKDMIDICVKYRNDFGYASAKNLLKNIVSFIEKQDAKKLSDKTIREGVTINLNDPVVKFHMNENKYMVKQKEEIINTLIKTYTYKNSPQQEMRADNLRLNALIDIVPCNERIRFDVDRFLESVDSKLYGLTKAKQAIASELYCANVEEEHKHQILTLIGPPGIGKSCLTDAIATAAGRSIVRIQLSSISDTDVIFGHHRDSVGASYGCLVEQLIKIGSSGAVVVFDEIDKIASPAIQNGLLKLLDDNPQLHDQFFGGFEFDLSKTFFVCTCNSLEHLPQPLINRMKIISLNGYSPREKNIIAKDYLVPNAVKKRNIIISDDIIDEICSYTSNECGIRSLKHDISFVINTCTFEQRHEKKEAITVSVDDVKRILGQKKYQYLSDGEPGAINALGVFEDVEGVVMPIKTTVLSDDKVRVTGLPKESIRESITRAETYLEIDHGIEPKSFHIDMQPAGINKDGSSAGLAIALSLWSAFTKRGISKEIAFTGDFDGRNILPVGGINLKLAAAKTAGCKTVFIPYANKDDYVSSDYDLDIRPVKTIEEVINYLGKDNTNKKSKS